jgi:hypothetical protein
MMNDVTMLSENEYSIKKEFATLDPLFKQHGWHISKNEANYLSYTTSGYETDVFEIKMVDSSKTIRVSMPIRNSPFQFNTSFNNCFQASEYIESRFLEFIDQKKIELISEP